MEALRACPDRRRAREADSRNVVAPYLGQVGKGTLAPLLGANGDGFRSVSALVGPNLLGNVFSGLGGDGIAIYGALPFASAGLATRTSGHNVSRSVRLLAWPGRDGCHAYRTNQSFAGVPHCLPASPGCLAYDLHSGKFNHGVTKAHDILAYKAGRVSVNMAAQLTLRYSPMQVHTR